MGVEDLGASYLIESETLKTRIERVQSGGLVVLDARPAAAYQAGHIPGAVNLDLFDYFVDTSSEGIDRLNQELATILGGAGIGGQESVVCYDDELGMRATRLLWFVEYAGHPQVGVLRGGFPGWLGAGGTRCLELCSARSRSFTLRPHPEILATVDYLNESGKGVPLDVRTLAEHRGEMPSSHGPCCPRSGRIPGSRWLEWTALLTPDRSDLKPPAEIQRLLAERGVTPEQEVITYCHRGARAAVAYVALKQAGFSRVRNYIGSWHEWAEIPHLPIETG
jgi:thiosulfate/3-mercaptopyruvate sulfurtransferase